MLKTAVFLALLAILVSTSHSKTIQISKKHFNLEESSEYEFVNQKPSTNDAELPEDSRKISNVSDLSLAIEVLIKQHELKIQYLRHVLTSLNQKGSENKDQTVSSELTNSSEESDSKNSKRQVKGHKHHHTPLTTGQRSEIEKEVIKQQKSFIEKLRRIYGIKARSRHGK